MTLIRFECDRCGAAVEGIHTETGTSGFYVVDGSAWEKYGRNDEHLVCDSCIHAMPEYKADYGEQPSTK